MNIYALYLFTAFIADGFYSSQLLRYRAGGTYLNLGNYKSLTHNLQTLDTALVSPPAFNTNPT